MDNAWLSLVPPLATIGVAIWSKRILPSLLLGLLVGSYLLHPSIVGGFEGAVGSITAILTDSDSLQVLLFLYLFSGLIALVRRAGGITAFSRWLSRYVHGETGVLLTLWALLPVTFIDCAFRIVGAGSIMRPLADDHKVSRERLAFMLNNTASPAIELIPIATTFVGFNIANIGLGLKAAGVEQDHSAYGILLHAIPFEFFSIVVLLITFLSIFRQWRTPPAMGKSSDAAMASSGGMGMSEADAEPEIRPRIVNLVIPLLSVILLSLFFFWYFGHRTVGADATLAAVIAATTPNKAMLVALVMAVLITGIAYRAQGYTVKAMTADIIAGGNELLNILIILTVAWAVGAVSQELHLSTFIRQQLGSSLPAWSIPALLFTLSSAVTYFIGAGWAAASLIMPFAVSLAVSSQSGIPICVAAVITGGTFGDVTSPVAGMTNMASGVARADQMQYLKYANPYNFAALLIAAVLFLAFGLFHWHG